MARPDASAKLAATKPKEGPPKALIAAVIAVVLVIVAGGAFLLTNPFGKLDAKGPKASVAEGNGVVMYPGKAKSGVPTVDVYEDFQCPVCGQLEKNNGKSIQQLAAAGDIKLVVHMMSFLDDNLSNDSSKRAANAGFCAADAGKFPEYHNAVFAGQPTQEGQGYTDDQLKKTFATGAGITGAAATTFTKCVDDGTYDDYVKDTEKRSNDDGINGTPAVKVDGKKLADDQVGQLIQQPNTFPAVLKAATGK
ncbi:DsbA family protein [Luteipulveratus mongoliensis]|uniref:Thioredoxin-like fold domain-containing protein n=1 Tax=Luteipulveratus mongoliensis TaxID=571913 RepID=A0A0K1JJ83_9MICO|nr:thioredoxin domain-containing protein [Luteipulveratus mongoliensis]AKU16756.1 hypothetical protein VV02_14230 [Luteipulveratus mongoliensis]